MALSRDASIRRLVAAGALLLASCRGERARLDAAIHDAGRRPFHGRLSGLAWAPPPSTTRGKPGEVDERPLRLRAAAAQLWQSSSDQETKAVAALAAGFTGDGMRRLEALIRQPAAAAGTWNDWSVALLSTADGDIATLCRALAAADRAIFLDASRQEARFNRALILDALSLNDAAERAYREYLGIDGESPWASEARDRLGALERSRTNAREWSAVLPSLERYARARDVQSMRAVVSTFPQEARVWTETDLLGRWGDRTLAGDGTADTDLAVARALGQALRDEHGDELAADAVAAIDAAAAAGRREDVLALARAHVAYRDARVDYRARRVAVAIPRFRAAASAFAAAQSPMRQNADYYLANALIDSADRPAARAIAVRLGTEVPARYRAFRAELDWLQAILDGMDGFPERALADFQHSAATFDALHEEQNATEIRDRIAALLTILGRTADAWELRRTTFPIAGRSGNPRRVETALYSAVTDALHEKNWDVAHSLLSLVTQITGGNVRLHAEALVWRPLAAKWASLDPLAETESRDAQRAVSLLGDAGLREDVANELRLVEGLLLRDEAPERSAELFAEHLASAERRGRTGRLSQVLVERARVLRRLGRTSEAEGDLRKAIDIVETQRAAIARPDLRDSFLGTSGDPYDELSDLLDASGRKFDAIAAADRRRARVLLDRVELKSAPPVSLRESDLSNHLDSGTALITYGLFEHRLVLYVATRGGLDRFEEAVSRSALEERCERLRRAIIGKNHNVAVAEATALYKALIAPAETALRDANSLIFVTDGVLQTIPFAALVASDGSFLVQHYAIEVAPSIARYLSVGPPPSPIPQGVLIAGDPAIDHTRFPDLPPLGASAEEAKSIAGMYRGSQLLLANRVTKEQMAKLLPACGLAHIASHAVAERDSRLLLAPTESDDGVLSSAEIAAMPLDGLQCVVLAACRTAAPKDGYGDLRSLSAAFLAAGARNVVATLWNVDDQLTRPLALDLHRGLRRGLSPARATQEVQLAMLRSGHAELADPSVWAALQVYGYD
jgi:CHAT domain-containing protein